MKVQLIKKVVFIGVLILGGYEVVLLSNTISWNMNKIVGIVLFVLSIIASAVIIVSILMSQHYKLRNFYISFPSDIAPYIKEMRDLNMVSPRYGTDTLVPGNELTSEIKRKVSRCNVCFVIITKNVTALQKQEIKEIRKAHKKIIPIIVNDSNLPSSLQNVVPINMTLDELKMMSIDKIIGND